MLALLRCRRIPYIHHIGSHRAPRPDLPEPKAKLLPTFYFATFYFAGPAGVEAVTDSTSIIQRLEAEHEGRSAIPTDPAFAFLNALI